MVKGNEGAKSLTVHTLQEWVQKGKPVQILDVRTPAEYGEGHIPQAISIPLEQVPARISDLSSAVPVVVVCHSGARAHSACNCLCGCSHPLDVWHLQGGTAAWQAAGFPVVQSVKGGWSIERQVRLMMGFLSALASALAMTQSVSWAWVSGVIGTGLVVAAVTGFCPVGVLLTFAPWNRSKA